MKCLTEGRSRHPLPIAFNGVLTLLTVAGVQFWSQGEILAQAKTRDSNAAKVATQDDAADTEAADPNADGDTTPAENAPQVNKPANDRATQPDPRNGNRAPQAKRAWIGIRLQESDDQPSPTDHAKKAVKGPAGIEVLAVYPSGPAARGGIRHADRIQSINGKAVTSPREVSETIGAMQPGAKAQIVVSRDGTAQTLVVVLGDAAAFHPQQASFTPQGAPDQQHGVQNGNPNGQPMNGTGHANHYDGVPEHAMMLEYNRRNAEQHQRMEGQIEELLKEVRSLRKEVQQLKSK